MSEGWFNILNKTQLERVAEEECCPSYFFSVVASFFSQGMAAYSG
jgi:hypothetical protein